MSQLIIQSYITADHAESDHVTAGHPESHRVTAGHPELRHITADHAESHHVTADHPESCHVLSVTPRYSRSVLQYPSLVSSVRDAPLVSARAAGIPKPTHFSPPVPELIPLSKALPMMGITFWCVWASYTTTAPPEVAASTIAFLEVAADAAEPFEVVVPAIVFPEAEVAAHAAEPFEAAVLVLAPCMVVEPNNTLSLRHVMVEGTVDERCTCPGNELFLVPDVTTVESPEVAASAAEPPGVSVVSTYELSSCPVAARRAVPECSSCHIMATEAI